MSQQEDAAQTTEPAPTNRLSCRGLPLDMTKDDLESIFESYTVTGDTFLSRPRRPRKNSTAPVTLFGYVSLADAEECAAAIRDLNNAEFDSNGSLWTLEVSMATPRKPRAPKKDRTVTRRKPRKRELELQAADPEVAAALEKVNAAGFEIRKAKRAGEDEAPLVPALLAAKKELGDLARPKAEAAKAANDETLIQLYHFVLQRVITAEERRAQREERKKQRAAERAANPSASSEPKAATNTRKSATEPRHTLFCEGLPQDMTKQNFKGIFEEGGKYTVVGKTYLSRRARPRKDSDKEPRPRYGYISLVSAEQCEAAIADLHNATYDSQIDDETVTWTLQVSKAKPRPQKAKAQAKPKARRRRNRPTLREQDEEVATALRAVFAAGRAIRKAKKKDTVEDSMISTLEDAKKALGDLVRPKFEAAKAANDNKLYKLYLPILQRVMTKDERRRSYQEDKDRRRALREQREAAAAAAAAEADTGAADESTAETS